MSVVAKGAPKRGWSFAVRALGALIVVVGSYLAIRYEAERSPEEWAADLAVLLRCILQWSACASPLIKGIAHHRSQPPRLGVILHIHGWRGVRLRRGK